MRIYVAAAKTRAYEVQAIYSWIKDLGHEVLFPWAQGKLYTDEEKVPFDEADRLVYGCLKGVEEADVVLVLDGGGHGVWIELGAAVMLKKTVLLVRGDQSYSIFYRRVEEHPNITSAIVRLVTLANERR